MAFEAQVEVEGRGHAPTGSRFLNQPRVHDGLVRVSRGAGLPVPLPDILGLALRVVDADGPGRHLDLLVNISCRSPVLLHVFRPALGPGDGHYSSSLPYRVGARAVVFGATPLLAPGAPRLRSTDDLVAAAATHALRFTLDMATLAERWERVGVVDLGRRLSDAENESLGFNPANVVQGVEPVGVLRTLRRRAYAASQEARRGRAPTMVPGRGR